MSLFEELKRRNVVRVGIAYVIVGWLVLQVADIVFDAIGTPGWVMQTLLVVLAIGFLFAVFFAWAFELTPEGIKRESEVDRSQSITPQTGRKLDYAIIALLALGMAYFVWESRFAKKGSEPFSPPVAQSEQVVEGEKRALTPETEDEKRALTPETKPADERLSIAVLPFDNRSNREEDQFFTDGIHDDLLTTIARIKSMKVISRTSVMEYRDTTKKLPEIARELGVAHILEGGIQRSGEQVRINVQLIDAKTDEHLWAEIYDRQLTAENLFAIQSEISKAIADALQATLSPEEERRIDAMPTQNLAAYDAYLRGKQLMATRDAAMLEQAMVEFRRALELDPDFALAWVGLSDSAGLSVQYGTLPERESLQIQEEAVQRALAIDEQLGEAWTSMAQIHESRLDYAGMEAAYRKAIEYSPNYATAYHWYSNGLRQLLSRANDSLELARRAVEIDPRSAIIGSNLAASYANAGLYTLAEQQYLKVIELHPDFAQGLRSMATFFWFNHGRYDQALQYLARAEAVESASVLTLTMRAALQTDLGDLDGAQATRQQMEAMASEDFRLGWIDLLFNEASGNVEGTREAWAWLGSRAPRSIPALAHQAAMIELANGDALRARNIYLEAEPRWEQPDEWERLIDFDPGNACLVAYAFSHSGSEELGEKLLQQSRAAFDALRLVLEDIDAWNPQLCQLMSGEVGPALDTIEAQLSHGHLFWWPVYDRLPLYESIRFEPRYQAALAERERRLAEQREIIAGMDLGVGT